MMPCLLLYICPSAYDQTVSEGMMRRSAKCNNGLLRVWCSPRPCTCRHVCVEKHETENICDSRAHSFPTAHESPGPSPNPPKLYPRTSEVKCRRQKWRMCLTYCVVYIWFLSGHMFTALIHRMRSPGGHNVLSKWKI